MNKFKEINWNPDKQALQSFARVLFIGIPFTALAWFCIIWFLKDQWILEVPAYILGIGWLIAAITYIVPPLGKIFYCIWFFMICVIETVVTTVLFTIAYYLVITPFGFFLNLAGKTTMKSAFKSGANSYWKDAEKITDPKRYFRQF